MSPYDQRRDPKDTDRAWAAGLFDGEGCIYVARQTFKDGRRRPNYRLSLNICQTHLQTLEEFEWAVGLQGNLASPKPQQKQNRVCYSLNYHGLAAIIVLHRLRQYLRRKGSQCQLAMDFQTQCEIHTHFGPKGCPEELWEMREWYFARMQSIKKDR